VAHVLFKKLSNAARYVGQYLKSKSYVDLADAFFIGGLAEKYRFNEQPRDRVVHFLANGAIENVGEVQGAWKTTPDAIGRSPRRAHDATVNWDKTYSVALVVCKNHRAELLAAAKTILTDAFAVLEERCAVARVGREGRLVHGKWAALVVPEFTSRNGDVHAHCHVILFTAIECDDGIVRTLHSDPLFAHTKWFGSLVTAEHAKHLNEMGFEVSRHAEGRLEIAGIPQELCDHWSSRRKEILAYMEANGLETPKQSDVAALASRAKKERTESLEEVFARHEREAERLGFDLAAIEARCLAAGHERVIERPAPDVAPVLAELESADFSRRPDFERALAEKAPGLRIGAREIVSLVERLFESLAEKSEALARDLDRRILDRAVEKLTDRDGLAASKRALDAAAREHALSPDVESVLRDLAKPGPALRVLDLPAALDRDELMAALGEAFRGSSIDCVAITRRKAEAETLHAAAEIPAFSVAKALFEWRRAREPAPFENAGEAGFRKIWTTPLQDVLAQAAGLRSAAEVRWRAWMRDRQPLDLADGAHVLIVDRAHEIPTGDLSEILTEARLTRATVILTGDSRRSELFRDVARSCSALWLAPLVRPPADHPDAPSLPLLPLRDPFETWAQPTDRGLLR
jgi:conjugative relaxase-like TrwC/TraI family protein